MIVTADSRWSIEKLRSVLWERYHLEGGRAVRLLREKMELPATTVLLNFSDLSQDLAFVGMPGEPFVEFQMQLRAESPLPNMRLLKNQWRGMLKDIIYNAFICCKTVRLNASPRDGW